MKDEVSKFERFQGTLSARSSDFVLNMPIEHVSGSARELVFISVKCAPTVSGHTLNTQINEENTPNFVVKLGLNEMRCAYL